MSHLSVDKDLVINNPEEEAAETNDGQVREGRRGWVTETSRNQWQLAARRRFREERRSHLDRAVFSGADEADSRVLGSSHCGRLVRSKGGASRAGWGFIFFCAAARTGCLCFLKAELILNALPTPPNQGALALFHSWHMGGALETPIWELGRGKSVKDVFGFNQPPSCAFD